MNNDGFEQFIKMNKNLTGPLNDMYKLWTEMYQHAAQQNLELVSESIARFSDQIKRLANARKPEELLNEQRNCLNEDVSAAVNAMQKVVHNNMESLEEMTKLCGTLCESAPLQKFAEKYQTERTQSEKHK
jgi:methyl-accepting chemotaxis protein